jgi:hypothetical protein
MSNGSAFPVMGNTYAYRPAETAGRKEVCTEQSVSRCQFGLSNVRKCTSQSTHNQKRS